MPYEPSTWIPFDVSHCPNKWQLPCAHSYSLKWCCAWLISEPLPHRAQYYSQPAKVSPKQALDDPYSLLGSNLGVERVWLGVVLEASPAHPRRRRTPRCAREACDGQEKLPMRSSTPVDGVILCYKMCYCNVWDCLSMLCFVLHASRS